MNLQRALILTKNPFSFEFLSYFCSTHNYSPVEFTITHKFSNIFRFWNQREKHYQITRQKRAIQIWNCPNYFYFISCGLREGTKDFFERWVWKIEKEERPNFRFSSSVWIEERQNNCETDHLFFRKILQFSKKNWGKLHSSWKFSISNPLHYINIGSFLSFLKNIFDLATFQFHYDFSEILLFIFFIFWIVIYALSITISQ